MEEEVGKPKSCINALVHCFKVQNLLPNLDRGVIFNVFVSLVEKLARWLKGMCLEFLSSVYKKS